MSKEMPSLEEQLKALQEAPEFDDEHPEFIGGRPVSIKEKSEIEAVIRQRLRKKAKKQSILAR